jgi:hypothetical protein
MYNTGATIGENRSEEATKSEGDNTIALQIETPYLRRSRDIAVTRIEFLID